MLERTRKRATTLLFETPTVQRLREKLDHVLERNAYLKNEVKRLLVFDKTPGELITPLLAERVRTLHRLTSPEAAARERRFASTAPIYASLRDRFRSDDPSSAHAVEISGLTVWIPDDIGGDGSLSTRIRGGWLPLDDIARVRRLVVGGTMLDVGANVGTTSIPRLALGDFNVVYAAEPHPANYECLVANAVRNGLEGRLLPDRVAISSWDGQGTLDEARGIGGHHLIRPGRRTWHPTQEVTCFTLDTWIRRLGVSPGEVTFVKVDVQGWDTHVLLGAPCLRAHKHIAWQMELAPAQMGRADVGVRDLCALAEDTFTHFQQLRAGADVPRPISELRSLLAETEAQHTFVNVLFYSQQSEAERLSA